MPDGPKEMVRGRALVRQRARLLFSSRQLSVSDGFGHCKFALGALEGALIVTGFIGFDAR